MIYIDDDFRTTKRTEENKDEIGEREENFRKDLKQLLEEYDMVETPGNSLSLPSIYKARERNQSDLIQATKIPEFAVFLMKYGGAAITYMTIDRIIDTSG